jgi:uncharacterized protein (UPF0332 family)
MNREIVLAEWRRGCGTLRAAEALIGGEFYPDSVSRSYYAVFHAAKAALQVHGIAVESHRGARRLFGLHLVRSGEIEAEWAAFLAEGLDDRLAADYDPNLSFSKEDADKECRRARDFLGRIRRYLLSKGLTENELQSGDGPPS